MKYQDELKRLEEKFKEYEGVRQKITKQLNELSQEMLRLEGEYRTYKQLAGDGDAVEKGKKGK